MKTNSWKTIKFGLMLLALPLVATAAASAHLQIVESSPISVGTEALASSEATVGLDRVHTVALNRNGGVDGRIVIFDASSSVRGLSNLDVRFVRNGQTIGQTTTDSNGVFAVQSLPEGIYSFVASGENGFAAYSVRVVADSSGSYQDVMEAVAVPQVAMVKDIFKTAPSSSPSSADKDSMDESGANRVVLKNGSLSGRILSAKTGGVQNTQVHILKDGISIATVMVDEQGHYTVPDMKPGVYAMVAVGPEGVAAVGFEAIEFDDQVSQAPTRFTYVSTAAVQEPQGLGQNTPVYTDMLNVYLIAPQDAVPTQPIAQDPAFEDRAMMPIEFAGENVAYGGAGGSFGPTVQSFPASGGGGGFGGVGGGGAGRLLGIAALSVGIVAIADSGNNPGPISPVTP